ncbi:DUF1206 domain-containing protein [Microbacterium sp. BK668]|uniref:DUF1206 domain-containing protein n=1 Tax=Microbacterium sp. BK668 TaxID=2512118 RepID=UPI00105C4D04|nr:DUF1206 domain-containing protein [Microbacterium sp. BK668]TDN88560.1 uncharacterized protein DUF1206 [Microbacterium sp. BK668]
MGTPSDVKAGAKDAARKVEKSSALRWLARAGYVANGVVHALVGVLVLILAFGGDGETDQAGAFKAIAAAPLGFAALWALAVALCALGAWHAAEGLLTRDLRGDVRGAAGKWGRRLAEWGQAVVFVALGLFSAAVAVGVRPSGERAAENVSGGILSIPGGPFVLGLIGLAIGGGGVAFVVMGVLRSFEKKVELPDGAFGAFVKALGVVGFLAKGLALVAVGIILVIAAVRVDPQAAGGLDGAMQALLRLPIGPWLAGLVGVGFLAYAVFCAFRARYARI